MRTLTFYEALWIMLLYVLISGFNWWLLVVVVLLFPRWRIFWDSVMAEYEYRQKHKRGVEEIEADVIKQMKEDEQRQKIESKEA